MIRIPDYLEGSASLIGHAFLIATFEISFEKDLLTKSVPENGLASYWHLFIKFPVIHIQKNSVIEDSS